MSDKFMIIRSNGDKGLTYNRFNFNCIKLINSDSAEYCFLKYQTRHMSNIDLYIQTPELQIVDPIQIFNNNAYLNCFIVTPHERRGFLEFFNKLDISCIEHICTNKKILNYKNLPKTYIKRNYHKTMSIGINDVSPVPSPYFLNLEISDTNNIEIYDENGQLADFNLLDEDIRGHALLSIKGITKTSSSPPQFRIDLYLQQFKIKYMDRIDECLLVDNDIPEETVMM